MSTVSVHSDVLTVTFHRRPWAVPLLYAMGLWSLATRTDFPSDLYVRLAWRIHPRWSGPTRWGRLAWRTWGRRASVDALTAQYEAVWRVWSGLPFRLSWETDQEATTARWCEGEMERLRGEMVRALTSREPVEWRP
jgi:hypothetical protein